MLYMSASTLYKCLECNKIYKSKQSLSNHRTKFHQNAPKCTKITPKLTLINERGGVKSVLNFKCEFCNKKFTRKYSLNRHIKMNRCKNNNINLENELFKMKIVYEKEINELKNQLLTVMNKQCKKHPKTLQKINNQLSQQNNNCIVNNNTINIIPLGQENLSNILSCKEQKMILNKKQQSLNYLIEYIHFNNKYPQFQNIIITNLKDNIAYKYDDKLNKFAATTKDELLEILLENRIIDIEDFYNFNYDKLNDNTQIVLNNFINKIKNDDQYFDKKKHDIKLILYNNSDNPNIS